MSRQLDQLPADATSLAREVATLKREMRELRAAHRLSSATVGLLQTATGGARIVLNQSTKSLQIYADDGETLLAELGIEDTGAGAGLWTRGLQNPNNISAYLASGQLQFRPVQDGLVDTPASVYYNTDALQYSDFTLTSGRVGATDHRALMILESLYAGQRPYVYVQGENSTPCNFDVLGKLTASNFAWGSVVITPSAANTPTSSAVTGLSVDGSSFVVFTTPVTSRPGSTGTPDGVTGTSVNGISSTGLTVWLNRQNTTSTTVNWMMIGI